MGGNIVTLVSQETLTLVKAHLSDEALTLFLE